MSLTQTIQAALAQQKGEMIAFLSALVQAESPSSDPTAQAPVQKILSTALADLAFSVEHIPGQQTGGHLLARSQQANSHAPQQLLVGHSDTVWANGTLKKMPLLIEDNIIRGPGVYDMKSGLTMMIFALRTIRDLGLTTAVTPLIFINSDEEIGSPESTTIIEKLAQQASRAFILEPALGPDGRLKTARKGVSNYQVVVHGRAAHAGLDPEKGVSAILEMSHLIPQLFALSDLANGVSVNVGLVEGGMRSNVIAPSCTAVVDVRTPTLADAERLHTAVHQLQPTLSGTTLQINGGISRPPLEPTAANQALWQQAQDCGRQLGLNLQDGMAGGGSDGNTTSRFTATLDGLGPIGDGAHATHEHILVDKWLERSALLTLLLISPL